MELNDDGCATVKSTPTSIPWSVLKHENIHWNHS